MKNTFHLIITSPLGIYLEDNIEYLDAYASDGNFGILPNYTSFVSDLAISKLSYKKDGKTHVFAISGGVLMVENNVCNVIINSIESKDDIDLNRAYKAKKRAEDRLNGDKNIDVERAKLALYKAINRIKIKEEN